MPQTRVCLYTPLKKSRDFFSVGCKLNIAMRYLLWYWRSKEKEEVDFVVTNKRKPVVVFECKLTDNRIHRPLIQLAKDLGGIPAVQLVYQDGIEDRKENSLVVSASRFFSSWV